MTTDESRESLDRAVEEAREGFVHKWCDSLDIDEFVPELDALIEAVSAKARAEERERGGRLEALADEYTDAYARWDANRKELKFPGVELNRLLAAIHERTRSSEEGTQVPD